MAMAMQATDLRSKMAIVRVAGRKETVHTWATGDHYAFQVMGKCIATDPDEAATFYWRIATPAEIRALDRQRAGGKLPGW